MSDTKPRSAPSLGSRLLNQCRHPQGWVGRLILRNMNARHAKVTGWGLDHVAINRDATILDVGCGGGKTVERLAALAADGKVYGIDFSDESVAASRRTNRSLIDAGRVEISNASVSKLPFADDTFDLVTAVETHYYWPDLNRDLREVQRVLRPGGTLLIIAEAYKGGKYDRILQRLDRLAQRGIMQYAHMTVSEHRDLFANAGYEDIQVIEQYDKGWLCAVGRKPR